MKKKEKKEKSLYELLGIDPHKSSVTEIFKRINRNDFPGSFCNIIIAPDNPSIAEVKHPDGSGSKSVQRCLHHLENGDSTIFWFDVFDALSMNTGDIASCGFVERYYITNIIAINASKVDKELILRSVAYGLAELKELYRRYGIEIICFGGESADLPDQTNSYIFDMDVYSRTAVKNVIKGNIQVGDKIFGFSSGGKAIWEQNDNSGQMSNGLTLSRIGLMHKKYAKKYPFLCRKDKPYRGRFRVDDYIKKLEMTVSEAILSPTRQWAIVIKLLIEELKKRKSFHVLHGISMNTGGGATKIRNLGRGIMYYKYMPEPLPYFKFIQQETNERWENMYTTFNMGIGLDIVGDNLTGVLAEAVKAVSRKTHIKSYELGNCYRNSKPGNKIVLETVFGEFEY